MLGLIINKSSKGIVSLIQDKDLKDKTREEYEAELSYVLTNLFMNTINVVLVIVLGVMLNCTLNALGCLLGLFTGMKYYGGKHAQTPEKCIFVTAGIAVLFGWLSLYAVGNATLITVLIMLVILVSVTTKVNLHPDFKKDNEKERLLAKKQYKKKGVIAIVILSFLTIAVYIKVNMNISTGFLLGLLISLINANLSKENILGKG